MFFLSSFGFAAKDESSKAYVIPIKGEINRATYNYVKDVMKDLNKENVDAIIFEIDTYGGLIDQAEKIKNLIISSPIPTIAYVNNKAESAGVLITIAAEKVVISNTGTIGSAETIPNTEKILSTILESGYEIWDGKDTTTIKNSCQVGKFLHMYYEDEKRGNR